MKQVLACRDVLAWAHNGDRLQQYCRDLSAHGFTVSATADPGEVGRTCNLIVTTTPARQPLFGAEDIGSGTHNTAVGSDMATKQELAAGIWRKPTSSSPTAFPSPTNGAKFFAPARSL